MYKTQEERLEWLKTAFSYHVIRPKLHFISKVTGALFFIYFIARSGYLDYFLEAHPKKTNIIIAIVAFWAANWLEDMISRATKNFAFSVFRWNESSANKAVAIGAAIVLVPLFTIGAITSFSGVDGNINKGDLGIDAAQASISKITKGNKSSGGLEANLKDYISMRKEERSKIEDQIKDLVDLAKKECKLNYVGKEREICNNDREREIKQDYKGTLDSFDLATNRTAQGKQANIDAAIGTDEKSKDKLIAMLYEQLDNKQAHIEWIGWIVGFIAVFIEFFALIDALLVYGIVYACKSDEKEMVTIGLADENKKGAFWRTLDFIKSPFQKRP